MTAAAAAAAKSLQSCLTLCDHTDGNPTGSSVPGILQARILEWVAFSFSSSQTHQEKIMLEYDESKSKALITPDLYSHREN